MLVQGAPLQILGDDPSCSALNRGASLYIRGCYQGNFRLKGLHKRHLCAPGYEFEKEAGNKPSISDTSQEGVCRTGGSPKKSTKDTSKNKGFSTKYGSEKQAYSVDRISTRLPFEEHGYWMDIWLKASLGKSVMQHDSMA